MAKFALELLYELVKPVIENTWRGKVRVDWGQTRVPCQLNHGEIGRVLIVPGSIDGDFGEIRGAKLWQQPAEPLFCLNQTFSVYCYGHDPQAQQSIDIRHDHVFLMVLHETIRQLHNVTHNWPALTSPVVLGNPRLLRPMETHILGRESVMQCSIEQPILDMFDDDDPTFLAHPTVVLSDSIGIHSEVSYSYPEGT